MPSKKTATTTEPADFEQALTELEALVERMEKGELPLESSLDEFERGVALTRRCQEILALAEQKVRLLTEAGEETDLPASHGEAN